MLKSCLAWVGVMLLALPAFGRNLCVNPGGTHGCEKTIQSAINAASPGDTLNVASGKYAGNVIVDRSIALLGSGAASTIIDATGVPNGPQALQLALVRAAAVFFRERVCDEAGHQLVTIGAFRDRSNTERQNIRAEIADKGLCNPFLDVVAATDVECFEIGVRRGLLLVNGGALLVH